MIYYNKTIENLTIDNRIWLKFNKIEFCSPLCIIKDQTKVESPKEINIQMRNEENNIQISNILDQKISSTIKQES